MSTLIQKIFGKTTEEPTQEDTVNLEKQNEFDKDSAYSILLKSELKLISSTNGVLMMCTQGIHAFLVMEYLVMEKREPKNIFVRSFQRLDFRPKGKAHIFLGKGNLSVEHVQMKTKEGIEKWEKSIKVGTFWEVSVAKVNETFDAAVAAHAENQKLFTDQRLRNLYSVSGDSSGSSLPRSTDTNNCLTFSRRFMTTYYAELGLTESNVECLNGNEKYIPVQSPWPMVLHYKNKQWREILLQNRV